MKQRVKELITSLYKGDISKEEFNKVYFGEKQPNDNYVLDLLRTGIKNKSEDIIEEAIVLLYTDAFSNFQYANELCELLQMTWHTKHEDVVMLLKDISAPSTVNSLYNAAEIEYEYLAYDDTYQFARKCIKALSSINTESAIDKLKLLSNSRIQKISEYAKKELCYKGLL